LHDARFDELERACGSLAVGIDAALARNLFPGIVASFGLPDLAELLALSRLVGMRCPGRHSIFATFAVKFARSGVPGSMDFRVERAHARFLRLDMAVQGARIGGSVSAFVRPPPQQQPEIAHVATRVGRGEFAESAAVVVGGSRGLGETTAKILAAGGASVTITYHRGHADAARVAQEIRNWGGACASVQLDALRPERAFRAVFAGRSPPRTIYYFATPQIFARWRGLFSRNLLRTFIDHYVAGFAAVVDAASEHGAAKLRVFFPSSVLLDDSGREFAEYRVAKRAGEDLCAFYNRFSDKVEILTERLPRTRTDQTSTLVALPARDALDVMLPIVRRLERFSTPIHPHPQEPARAAAPNEGPAPSD